MSCNNNTPNVNKTFIIEPLSLTGGSPTLSACTALFTNLVESCSGDTSIQMGTGLVTFNSNVNGINSFTANTIESTTYLSGGTNILDIINADNTFITGGTFSRVSDTLSLLRNDGASIVFTGLTDTQVTGGTYNNNTGLITFNTNYQLSAFTVDLSTLDLNDTFTTGATLTNGTLTLKRNDGVDILVTGFSQTFTGNTSGNCIGDLYVSRIHSCSPLHINPNDEGKIFFGSTSGITIDVTNPSISIGGEDVSDNTSLQLWTSGSTQRAIRMRDKVTNSKFNFWTTTANTGEYILKLDGDNFGSTVATFYSTGFIKSKFDGDGSKLINIPISGVTNLLTELGNKTDNDNFTAHTGDTTIHFTKSSINLSDLGSSAHTHTLSEITDFNSYSGSAQTQIDGKTDLTLFNSHTGDTNNPHQTSFSNLTSTAHTHTISDVTNLQSELNSKLNISDFNTYSGSVQTQLNTKIENGINSGGANELFSGKSGTDLYFRTLSGGTNTTISTINDVVRVDVSIPVDTNTYVTGFTYNNVNTFTLSRNGGLSDLTSTISVLSGITYYGDGSNLTGINARSTDTLITTGNSSNSISILNNINDNTTTFIESYVTCHNNSNNYGFWKRTIAVNKNGGSINIIRERADFDSQSSGLTPTNVVYSASSGNLIILVSGETGKTYNWVSKWEII